MDKKIYIMNLYDYYYKLLTDKQQEYLSLYYCEDLSLAEIAQDLDVSRNAVYDNLKRAVNLLEEYEEKLHLLEKHLERTKLIEHIEQDQSCSHDQLYDYLEMLKKI